MGIRQNIIKLREIFGITQAELANIAGVSRGAVSQWEGGFSEPRMGAIERIVSHYGLSKMNIIEDGGMDLLDPVTKKPIALIANATTPPASRIAYAPLLGMVHAGEAQEPMLTDGSVSLPYEVWERHPDGYFLKVEGDCMDRIYPEGCMILVDPYEQPQNGSIAVVSIDGCDYVMRRLYRGADTLILAPDSYNPEHADIVVRGDEHTVEFAGKVVWFQSADEME